MLAEMERLFREWQALKQSRGGEVFSLPNHCVHLYNEAWDFIFCVVTLDCLKRSGFVYFYE